MIHTPEQLISRKRIIDSMFADRYEHQINTALELLFDEFGAEGFYIPVYPSNFPREDTAIILTKGDDPKITQVIQSITRTLCRNGWQATSDVEDLRIRVESHTPKEMQS